LKGESRRAQAIFSETNAVWYVLHDGKQINLGADKAVALEEYYRLMAASPDARCPLGRRTSVQEMIGRFLEWVKANCARGTFEFYRDHLIPFGEFVGARLKMGDLKRHYVTDWVQATLQVSKRRAKGAESARPLSDNYRHNAVRCVKACFKWAYYPLCQHD
jgi:hypothetical protein